MPRLPQDLALEDLISKLKKHFKPKPLVVSFHRQAQAVGESISDYIAELRKLTILVGVSFRVLECLSADSIPCAISMAWTRASI